MRRLNRLEKGTKKEEKKTFPFFADVSVKVDNKEESSISVSVACQRELYQKLIHINKMDILNWIVWKLLHTHVDGFITFFGSHQF